MFVVKFMIDFRVTDSINCRTYRFAILGFSLSNLLDVNNPQDLLRGLLNIVTEYDQSKEESDKPKIVSLGLLTLRGRNVDIFIASPSENLQKRHQERSKFRYCRVCGIRIDNRYIVFNVATDGMSSTP